LLQLAKEKAGPRSILLLGGDAVPVIYMTGNDSPAVREAARKSGCVACLINPVSARSLIEQIEESIGVWFT
jgi:AmiR/NasT family two-component response regulator